jgi:branched-subunit amino acid aminotransferase/4-amino-4-deoxychorismate lyase
MEVILNGRRYQQEAVNLPPNNRAFCYADGLFETIIARRGTSGLLPFHYARLLKGLEVLQIEVPFTEKELESYIWQLSASSKTALLRLRLQVWRKSGGLYTPTRNEAEFLLTASSFEKPSQLKQKVSFSDKVQLTYSAYSSLKTMNALPYVLAGLEAKERGLDDIILMDGDGHVAESGSANLFWVRDDCWYTPHLKSGCIAGVMRAYLLNQLHKKDIPVQEVLQPKEKLLEASALIATNATGLYTIRQLDYHTFEGGRELLSQFIQLPLL